MTVPKAYRREVFERLRQTLEFVWCGDTLVDTTDDYIAPHYEILDEGVFLRPETGIEWTPACEHEGPDAPDPLTAPAIPFPFSANELAAFFLDGWGYFLGDRFAMLEGGPDEETMREVLSGARDAKPREALIAAGHALKEARSRAADLEAERERTKLLFNEAQAAHRTSGKCASGTSRATLRQAREAKDLAEGAWRQRMVHLLLSASAPARHTETAEERRARRAQMAVDAGLHLPDIESARLPAGINALAEKEGISKAAFAKDLKAYIGRKALKERFKNVKG